MQLRRIFSVQRWFVSSVAPLVVVLISLLDFADAAIPCRTDANHVVDMRILERGEHLAEWLLDNLKFFLLSYSHVRRWTWLFNTLLIVWLKLRWLSLQSVVLSFRRVQPDFKVFLHQLFVAKLLYSQPLLISLLRVLSRFTTVFVLAVFEEESSSSIERLLLACNEVSANNLGRYLIFFIISLGLFLLMFTFLTSLYSRLWSRCRFAVFHVLCSNCKFWYFRKLWDLACGHLAETLSEARFVIG